MKLLNIPFFSAALLLVAASFAHATSTGLTNLSGTYAHWDSFASATFTNAAAGAGNGFSSAGLSQLATGGPPFGPQSGGDLFYSFVTPTSWSLSASTDFEISALTLQIKLSTTNTAYFNPLLSFGETTGLLGTASPAVFADNVGGFGDEYVITYTWSGLAIGADQPFTIGFTASSGSHVAVDGVSIQAVPEPGTWASLSLGAGLLFAGRRWMRRSK